jgi:hypothetical protein
MTNRTILLTAAFLALWLPAQALATVLVHCMSMDSQSGPSTSDVMHSSVLDDAVEDCHGHGQTTTGVVETTPKVASHTAGHYADSVDCVHCSGGCHKLQSMLAPESDAEHFSLASDDRVTRTTDLATGYPDFPIRPPINILSA